MYSFAPLSAPLNRMFVGRGCYENSGNGGTVLLTADYSFELVWRMHEDGTLARGKIESPQTKPFELEIPPSTPIKVWSYRIRPASAAALLNEDLARWTETMGVNLDQFTGPLKQIARLSHPAEIEQTLLKTIQDLPEADPVTSSTLDLLARRTARKSVAEAVSDLGYSHSQVSRRFSRSTGVTLELYARLVRIQNAKQIYGNHASIESTAIAAGFADGAHLNHECRKLTGRSFRDFCRNFTLPK